LNPCATFMWNNSKTSTNAEQQLIKALPKMAKAASSEQLKAAFEDHLGQTRQHAQRIETIFEQMGEKAKGKTCKARKV
jgi:ferritin-like metal-binding protein YciE